MHPWEGRHLGNRTVAYDERDAILYALAVGADPDRLDLVFEDQLRVLPTFALTLAQWAPDALGSAGAFDTSTAVHGAQRLEVRAPLPRSGELTLNAEVERVWDKGSAAIFDVVVECDHFRATWAIFAPGCGGFGGERGEPAPPLPSGEQTASFAVATAANQAALYRLLGDRHHMHIDPVAAQAAGQPRPFLHGLATMASLTLGLADAVGAHPADLTSLEGRFAAPVFPGDVLAVIAWVQRRTARFEATADGRPAVRGGTVTFA
jgi:acyl dehydratase